MTALTTTAIRSLILLFGGAAARPATAPWMRNRPSEQELERWRIAESHVPYRF